MKSEEEIEEILLEASSVGMREEVIEYVKKHIQNDKTLRIVDVYNQAYTELVENKLNK
jgi:CRISPR/Cas system-associated protein Cas5 (RAMP superfamily)